MLMFIPERWPNPLPAIGLTGRKDAEMPCRLVRSGRWAHGPADASIAPRAGRRDARCRVVDGAGPRGRRPAGAGNGFFVAAEFALVSVRGKPGRRVVADGRRNAKALQRATDRLDAYLAATQLGITLASLALGWWIGEPALPT